LSDTPKGPWFCDFNAGAPVLPEVLAEFVATEQRCPANPASTHGAGRRARGVLEQARERIANLFELPAEDVVFTSGGTEAANMAVRGLGDQKLPVLISDVEHPATRESAERRGTCKWDIDAHGAAIVTAPQEEIGLVCLVHAQSELGTLQDVETAIEVARNCDVPVVVDAAQTLGRVSIRELITSGAVVALSPHKAGGLRGHGVLLGRRLESNLLPLMLGGGQEFGLRPGTQSPSLAAANSLAIEIAITEQPQRALAMARNRKAFLGGLAGQSCPFRVLTPLAKSVPNTLMLCFEDVDGRNLLPALDLAGVQASHGSACSSGSMTAPKILTAIGVDDARARACVRFSFDWKIRDDECAHVGALVGDVMLRLRKKN
jgi:cysteine desulfurase